jgi:hypothetical protein
VDADHRVIEWAQQRSLFVLVNRQTQWGNPFRIDDDGDRPTVIRKYVDHYLPHKDRLNREIASLQGRALGCHCAPLACHGDILAELANRELTHD